MLNSVKKIGRVGIVEGSFWLALSGTGVEFSVTGHGAGVTLLSDNSCFDKKEDMARVAVFLDGERIYDILLEEPVKEITVFESETEETHTVKVLKLSESAMSTCGIVRIETDGVFVPTEEKMKLIEFIGDSITCGYGVDDEDRDHHFATATEDVTKAYAFKTAEKLGADYSMVSFSGYGIVSGYTATGEKMGNQLVPDYYEKLGYSYHTYLDTYTPQEVNWDFAIRQPDCIVVNLGTNDMSYVLDDENRREEYISGYVRFLKTVRSRNPETPILCVLGLMGEALCPAAKEATERFCGETGDCQVYYMGFSDQLPEDGYVADWHPTEVTHEKAAVKLADEIKKIWKE